LHCWRRNINRLDKIKNEENPMDYFEDLFMFMENNPNIDYGMPGPIVHFMESYYKKGYEDELLKSVKRKPTQRMVWMLNRVLNDVNLIGREKYIGVMEEAIKRTDE
jgi:UDP-glucose 6-dehydrogenase